MLGRLRLAGRYHLGQHKFHLGLRTQVLLLGVTGVVVVGVIYLAGRQIEDRSRAVADRFAGLESPDSAPLRKPATGARDCHRLLAEADRQQGGRA
ncbi:hypothetical protein [Bradyrhizobium liaoningense]|uniref:hypothetical protein n=1 Tax=Bradyrhizobium liaoningense TaxID=43992 RepID=UPI001BACBEB4|nr:hypothetical protein [Bradyrhizobium liaoningense]MBR0859285.1 hypothetical protein [Bradyrhizobium liaoningense]